MVNVNVNEVKNFKLFVDLRIEELEKIISICKLKEFNKDEIIIQEYMEGKELYIVQAGEVRITKVIPSGDKVTFNTLKKGDFFGALSFLTQRPHSATATSVSKGMIITIDKDDFEEFIEENPKIGFKILKKIINELSDLLGQMNRDFIAVTGYMWR